MVSSNLAGSFSGKGKVTQVDKYGNVTCETVCVVLKVSKTCAKGNVYLVNVIVGNNVYNSLIVKQTDGDTNLWYGVGEGVTQFLNFKADNTSLDFSFSSYTSGNFENWSAGDFTLKPCKCQKQDKCGCDCERH